VVIFVILVGAGGYYLYVTVLSKGGGSSSNRAVAVPSRSEDAGDDGGGDSLSTDVNSKQVLQPSRQMKKDALSGNDSIDQDSLLAGYSGPDPKPFDLESQGQDTASLVAMEDAGSNMGTSASLVEDNMSYAYSLDAGNVGGGGTTVGDGDSTARETTGGRRYSRKVIAPCMYRRILAGSMLTALLAITNVQFFPFFFLYPSSWKTGDHNRHDVGGTGGPQDSRQLATASRYLPWRYHRRY
jgi:hypothetical protein